jgi:hypothetical protein
MPIFSFFILNKNAGMIYSKEYSIVKNEFERSYAYPLELKLDRTGAVKFGAKDPVRIGHSLISVSGQAVFMDKTDKNKLRIKDLKGADDLFEYLENPANFPCVLKLGKQQLSTNDKLVLTGRFFGYIFFFRNFELVYQIKIFRI